MPWPWNSPAGSRAYGAPGLSNAILCGIARAGARLARVSMTGQEARPLPKVKSRKEFMDTLYGMNHPPKSRKLGQDPRGRFMELKTYILECNGPFGSGRGKKATWDVGNTGVDDIKILTMQYGKDGARLQFYMDKADKRYFLFHTEELAEDANAAMEMLVEDGTHKLDHTWFHSGLMERWAGRLNGRFSGYVINHGGLLREKSVTLKLEASGTEASRLYRSLTRLRGNDRIMSHEAIEMSRGSKKSLAGHVEERISNTGYFSIKRGKSIQDHLHIVGDCKDEYADMVANIEKCRMGPTLQDGSRVYGGKPIEIMYPKVERLEHFVDTMFRATQPFRLWGIKVKRKDNYYTVPAVDLHEGSPIDFEITPTFMRVYTRKESCGNTILRLLAGLRARCGVSARCGELEC